MLFLYLLTIIFYILDENLHKHSYQYMLKFTQINVFVEKEWPAPLALFIYVRTIVRTIVLKQFNSLISIDIFSCLGSL